LPLTANSSLRALAFLVVAAAALAGVATRVATARFGAAQTPFAGIQTIDLKPGQSLAGAVFDGIADDDVSSVRLKASGCGEHVFASPILLTAVEIPQAADRAYLKDPHYRSLDVYNGRVRDGFSHVRRLIARAFLETYNSEAGYYVRFYAPSNCEIPDDDFVKWAGEIMRLASRPGAAGEAGARAD
jgi:hypothetical protein